MKKLIFIPLLFACLSLTAGTYYVATTGNNSDPGTLAQPWLTWAKAFSTAVAGDTVYFRGGVYYVTSTVTISNSGTAVNPICFFNYPGEVPILDGINKSSPSDGLRATGRSYIHLKGLTVRRNRQLIDDYKFASGIVLYEGCDNITITNCTSYANGTRGFFFRGVLTVNVYNCDAYDNIDSLSVDPTDTGDNGDGFMVHALDNNTDGYVTFQGCRAWHNSDDGWDVNHEGYVEMDSCWTWGNGLLTGGNGCGFKLALSPNITTLPLTRKLTNSIATYNRFNGISTNDRVMAAYAMNIYNNISYHNANYGAYLYNTISSDVQELKRIFRNNISYANTAGAIGVGTGGLYTHDHNSWDISGLGSYTNADFISVDSAGLTGARTVGGYLPVLNFLKPASTARGIDQGTDVGYGNDLGPYQYVVPGVEIEPAVVFTTGVFPAQNSVTINCNVYDDGGGTVTERGVCISTSANPTTANDHTDNGSGTGAFQALIGGLTASTAYHIRAYAINEIGTSYSADVPFSTTGGTISNPAGIIVVVIGGTEYIVVDTIGGVERVVIIK
jgi:hypothetical protein